MESDFEQPTDPSATSTEVAGSDEQGAVEPRSDGQLDVTSEPFVGRWNQLISSTNWEKGRIIAQWRDSLMADGAPATEYSDEAWSRRVGGVTAPHVGRLRRVYEAFGDQYKSYPGLYWSHFLAALDWDDAPLWLEGAMRSGWSVSQMRESRWEANGGDPEQRPRADQIVASDQDEDVVMPAQGGGGEGRYDGSPDDVSAGPLPEEPDFGDAAAGGAGNGADAGDDDQDHLEGAGSPALIQPFAGLPDLPGDLSEALELFKLAILRHKAAGWNEVDPEVVHRALDGLKLLVSAPAE